jgi:hypothetical protein
MAAATTEFFDQAELHRLRGVLHQKGGDSTEAQHWLNEATKIARTQAARLLELRAATSLAGLWRDQGRRIEACNFRPSVYGWFAEGFDTESQAWC